MKEQFDQLRKLQEQQEEDMRAMEKEAGVLLSPLLPTPLRAFFAAADGARLQLRSTCGCVHHLCVHLCSWPGLGAANKAGGAGGATGG